MQTGSWQEEALPYPKEGSRAVRFHPAAFEMQPNATDGTVIQEYPKTAPGLIARQVLKVLAKQ